MKFPMLTGVFLVSALGLCTAFAQTEDGGRSGRLTINYGALSGFTTFEGFGLMRVENVTGQPYSAKRVSQHSQTLADGTHIKQKRQMSLEYRDSEGRSRTERNLFGGPGIPAAVKDKIPMVVRIYDPVAGYAYTLDGVKHIAHRAVIPALTTEARPVRERGTTMPSPPAVSVWHPLLPRRQVKQEPIGTEMIEGVLVVGNRITITTPTGAEGNDRPLTRICEHWQSEEMKITVLSKCSDPRTGETTMRMDHLDRSEPDAALFQVPPDYTIVDDHGRFSLGFTAPQ